MTQYENYAVTELSNAVSRDKLSEMKGQVEGWQGLAFLLQNQLERLGTATKTLAAQWNSPAGQQFIAEIGRIQTTLNAALSTAQGNHKAWGAITTTAERTRDKIYSIESEYYKAKNKADADFEQAKKADAENYNWGWLGLSDLADDPEAPKDEVIRAPFDRQARDVLQAATDTYQYEFVTSLWTPPPYDGPTEAPKPVTDPGVDPKPTTTSGRRVTTPKAEVPPVAPPIIDVFPPPISHDPQDGVLVGTPISVLPPPTVPTPPPVLPPQLPTTVTVPMPPLPIVPLPEVPPPAALKPPITGRTPLLPNLNEPGPSVVGRRPGVPQGRPPALSDESVIGKRGLGRVPGGSGESVPRGRPAATPRAVESVVGRSTPSATGRRSATGRAAGAGEDGVVRPGRRAESATGGGGAGSRRGRRRDERDQVDAQVEGTEIWEVDDDGVPAVVEPVAPFDGSAERSGPHLGDRRWR